MKKIIVILLFTFLLTSCFFDKKENIENSKSNIIVNSTGSELITDTVKKYKLSLEEKINKFEKEYREKGCSYLKQEKVFDIGRAYIFLKNDDKALILTKDLYNCNKELYSGYNLQAFQYLDYLGYVLNGMGDKKGALDIYKKLVKDFPSSKFDFVSKDVEDLFKSEIERLSK